MSTPPRIKSVSQASFTVCTVLYESAVPVRSLHLTAAGFGEFVKVFDHELGR